MRNVSSSHPSSIPTYPTTAACARAGPSNRPPIRSDFAAAIAHAGPAIQRYSECCARWTIALYSGPRDDPSPTGRNRSARLFALGARGPCCPPFCPFRTGRGRRKICRPKRRLAEVPCPVPALLAVTFPPKFGCGQTSGQTVEQRAPERDICSLGASSGTPEALSQLARAPSPCSRSSTTRTTYTV